MSLESISSNITQYTNALDYAARSTPFFLVLCGLLAYYYREKIKSLLARSLSVEIEQLKAEFAKDLAQHQSALQRELEAYKVSLIAETEKIKAAQDVRKSIALKFYERRFQAITSILDIHMGIDTDLGSLLSANYSDNETLFKEDRESIRERLRVYGEVYHSSIIFISNELREHVLDFRGVAFELLSLRKTAADPAIEKDNEAISELLELATNLEGELKKSILNYENFGEDSPP